MLGWMVDLEFSQWTKGWVKSILEFKVTECNESPQGHSLGGSRLYMHCLTNSSYQPHVEGISVLIMEKKAKFKAEVEPYFKSKSIGLPNTPNSHEIPERTWVTFVALLTFTKKNLDSSSDVTNFWVLKANHLYYVSLFLHYKRGQIMIKCTSQIWERITWDQNVLCEL